MRDNNNSGGLGFTSALTLIFITLKLLGKINWSWLVVLSPIIIEIILAIILTVFADYISIKKR